MMSHAVSHGRLTPLVGKTLVAGGLNVYFGGIRSSFAFILLTYKILIMLCIGAYCIVHWALCGRVILFIIIKKGKTKRTLVECGHL